MSLNPITGLLERRGEWVWLRNVSRYVDYDTGEAKESYVDNQSCLVRFVKCMSVGRGQSVWLPIGTSVMYGGASDFWNDSVQVAVNDVIVKEPGNYSRGESTVWRVSKVSHVPSVNQSQKYVQCVVKLTGAKE